MKLNSNPCEPGRSASGTHGENDDSASQGIESASDNERATAVSRFGVFPRSAWATYMGCVIRCRCEKTACRMLAFVSFENRVRA